MQATLEDIRARLRRGEYKNEEHVRLSLVARLLQALGWNPWNPVEVNAEFAATPQEDSTRVDFALFSRPSQPAVFIETKGVGKVVRPDEIERQLRDYNRNNTAMFSIITDGRFWWLYLSQTGGEFRNKRFATIDVTAPDVTVTEASFRAFLHKDAIDNGSAELKAKAYLASSQKQRCIRDCLPQARRRVQDPPFPSLPEAIVQLVKDSGHDITTAEAAEFLRDEPNVEAVDVAVAMAPLLPPPARPNRWQGSSPVSTRRIDAEHPEDLRFTSVDSASFGDQRCSSWNELVEAGLRLAGSKGTDVAQIARVCGINVESGQVIERGFRPIRGTGVSYQNKDASGAWRAALQLAKQLQVAIHVQFHWRHDEGAAHPGETAGMNWPA